MTRGMPDAAAFARTWADEWNSHDLGSILAHYAPDVAFRSPLAARVLPGSDGTVRGLAGLREYWSAGLAAHPDLRFEVLGVFEGTDTLVILFRNEAGELRAEALTFRDGLIVEGRGMFPAGQGIPDQRERAACRRMSPVAAGVVAAGVVAAGVTAGMAGFPSPGDLVPRSRSPGATEAASVTAALPRDRTVRP